MEQLPNTDPHTVITRPNWIYIYGERFYRQEFVHNGFQEDDLPVFGKIIDLLVVAGSVTLLQLEVYQTIGILIVTYRHIKYHVQTGKKCCYSHTYSTNILIVHTYFMIQMYILP